MLKIIKGSDDYYSQKNNEYDPMNSCNVTSMIQACAILGYEFPSVSDFKGNLIKQPEDRLYWVCNHDPQVLQYYKKLDPTEFAKFEKNTGDFIRPNEYHKVLSYATNIYLSMSRFNNTMLERKGVTEFTYFSTNTLIPLLYSDICNGKPVVMSGKFSGLHHVVTLVGMELDDNYKTINYIINDPYGETYNYKAGLRGCQIKIPTEKFIEDFKPLNNETIKWAHRFN